MSCHCWRPGGCVLGKISPNSQERLTDVLIARMYVLPFLLVYAERAWRAHCNSVYGVPVVWCLLWPDCSWDSGWDGRRGRAAVMVRYTHVTGTRLVLTILGVGSSFWKGLLLPLWLWLLCFVGVPLSSVACTDTDPLVLPNMPTTTSWLSEQERQLALWRLEQDIGDGHSEEESLLRGFKMALKDVKVYVVAVILFSIATSASVLNFFPTVVETLGYGSTETLLLTAPPYVSVSQ